MKVRTETDIRAALMQPEPFTLDLPGTFVDWCTTHASKWEDDGQACEASVFADPYGSGCVHGRAYVEVLG